MRHFLSSQKCFMGIINMMIFFLETCKLVEILFLQIACSNNICERPAQKRQYFFLKSNCTNRNLNNSFSLVAANQITLSDHFSRVFKNIIISNFVTFNLNLKKYQNLKKSLNFKFTKFVKVSKF